MKRIIILLFPLLFIFGCTNRDDVMSVILKSEQEHLDRYNKIQRLTTDTNTKKYIQLTKDTFEIEAFQMIGYLEGREEKPGRVSEKYTKTKKLLLIYIDSCNTQ